MSEPRRLEARTTAPNGVWGNDPRENDMTITRRHVLAGAIAAPAIIAGSRSGSAAVRTIKISHQFPGGTLTEGDFRDRLCRKFGAELEKRTNGRSSLRSIRTRR